MARVKRRDDMGRIIGGFAVTIDCNQEEQSFSLAIVGNATAAATSYSPTSNIISITNISIPSYCRCTIEGSQIRAPGNVNNDQPLVSGRLPSSWDRLDSKEQQAKDGEDGNGDAPNMHSSSRVIEWG